MKTQLFTIAVMFCAISSNAQIHLWSKGITGIGNTDVYGKKTYVEPSGNAVYTFGEYSNYDSTNTLSVDPVNTNQVLSATTSLSNYLVKMTPDGALIWAHSFSPSLYVQLTSISTDGAGSCYVAGYFNGTMDVDPGNGTYLLSTNAITTAFVLKLDAAGNFVWAQQYNGLIINDITIRSNALFCGGNFTGQCDFDNGPANSSLAAQDAMDCFVMRLNTDGDYQWVKGFGSSGNTTGQGESVYQINVAPDGMINVSGILTVTGDFNPDAGVTTLSPLGATEIFLLKLSATGDFQWALSTGTNVQDGLTSMSTSSIGSIYLTSTTAQPDNEAPFEDIFVSKFSPDGNFLWSKQMGGEGSDQATSVSVDEDDNLYLAGDFGSSSIDFDPGIGETMLHCAMMESRNSYLLKFTPEGELAWATSLNGTLNSIWGSAYHNGSLYTTGYFFDALDMAPGTPFNQLNGNGIHPGSYLSKLDVSNTLGIPDPDAQQVLPFTWYPNPSHSMVHAQLEPGSIVTIYDLTGSALTQQTSDQETTALNMEAFAPGTYLVEVHQNGRKTIQKLVKN